MRSSGGDQDIDGGVGRVAELGNSHDILFVYSLVVLHSPQTSRQHQLCLCRDGRRRSGLRLGLGDGPPADQPHQRQERLRHEQHGVLGLHRGA